MNGILTTTVFCNEYCEEDARGNRMLRIALLGCGRIGVMHATNIASHRRAELAGVFDIRADAAMRSVKDGRTVKVSEIA
jgi:predicted dehydrogenase